MRTPRQLYAAERIIYHPELLTCLTAVTSW